MLRCARMLDATRGSRRLGKRTRPRHSPRHSWSSSQRARHTTVAHITVPPHHCSECPTGATVLAIVVGVMAAEAWRCYISFFLHFALRWRRQQATDGSGLIASLLRALLLFPTRPCHLLCQWSTQVPLLPAAAAHGWSGDARRGTAVIPVGTAPRHPPPFVSHCTRSSSDGVMPAHQHVMRRSADDEDTPSGDMAKQALSSHGHSLATPMPPPVVAESVVVVDVSTDEAVDAPPSSHGSDGGDGRFGADVPPPSPVAATIGDGTSADTGGGGDEGSKRKGGGLIALAKQKRAEAEAASRGESGEAGAAAAVTASVVDSREAIGDGSGLTPPSLSPGAPLTTAADALPSQPISPNLHAHAAVATAAPAADAVVELEAAAAEAVEVVAAAVRMAAPAAAAVAQVEAAAEAAAAVAVAETAAAAAQVPSRPTHPPATHHSAHHAPIRHRATA